MCHVLSVTTNMERHVILCTVTEVMSLNTGNIRKNHTQLKWSWGKKIHLKKKSSTTFSYIKLIQFVYTRIAIEAARIS